MDWTVPSSVWFPILENLELHNIRLVDEDPIRRFLQGCLLLELFILFVEPFESESEEFTVLDFSSLVEMADAPLA